MFSPIALISEKVIVENAVNITIEAYSLVNCSFNF